LSEDGSYYKVWESTRIDNSLDPRWSAVTISMATLCNGDIHRPLKIDIYDWEKSGKHVFMGQVTGISVSSLISNGATGFNVIEPEKQKRSNYKNSGTLRAQNVSIEHIPTFADVSYCCLCFLSLTRGG
jgi:hypothetical protein